MPERRWNEGGTLAERRESDFNKAYAALIEAQKSLSSSYIAYLVLLASVLLLGILGEGDKAKLPGVDVTLDRYWAAWLVLDLSCLALFRYVAYIGYSNLLRRKMYALDGRYQEQGHGLWHLDHPSIHQAGFVLLFASSLAGRHRALRVIGTLFAFGSVGLVVVLAGSLYWEFRQQRILTGADTFWLFAGLIVSLLPAVGAIVFVWTSPTITLATYEKRIIEAETRAEAHAR